MWPYLDRNKAGFGLQTIVMVCLSHHQISSLENVKERLTRMDEVLECHQLTGEVDFLLKVAVKDMTSYTDFVNNKLSGIPGIQNVKTSFILETLKNNTALKLVSELTLIFRADCAVQPRSLHESTFSKSVVILIVTQCS